MRRQMERFDSPEFRGEAVVCSVPGCHASTRLGKPWCFDHIDQSPLAAKIMREIAQRASDVDAAGRNRINMNNYLLRETVRILREHPGRTVEGVAKDLQAPHAAVRNIFHFLFRKRLAIEGATKRRSTTATLATRRRKAKTG